MKLNNSRLNDPLHYREIIHFLVFRERFQSVVDRLEEKFDCFGWMMWLGSNVGQSYLTQCRQFIETYPYSDEASYICAFGNVVNHELKTKHDEWVDNLIKILRYEK